MDGQVLLVRLQTDNFRLFFRQQTDKRQTSVCKMSIRKQIKENRLVFRFPFDFFVKRQHIYI